MKRLEAVRDAYLVLTALEPQTEAENSLVNWWLEVYRKEAAEALAEGEPPIFADSVLVSTEGRRPDVLKPPPSNRGGVSTKTKP